MHMPKHTVGCLRTQTHINIHIFIQTIVWKNILLMQEKWVLTGTRAGLDWSLGM